MDPDVAEPLFARVHNALRTAILEGELVAGQRLPSESELSREHGVSRITVRQALADLQASGLVRTVNGRGSFVSEPTLPGDHGPLVGALEAMRKRGFPARGRLVSHRTLSATDAVADLLNVPVGTPVGAVRVMRYCNEVPFALGTAYTDPDLARRVAAENLAEHDLATVFSRFLGIRIETTRVVVKAVPASAGLARSLRRDVGSPLLRILTVSLDYNQQVVSYADTMCNPDMMDYRVTLRRPARANRG